jgi:transcriptional activator of eps genes
MQDDQARFDAFLASYAGCDGGNPAADVWVCGIEHGGELEDISSGLTPDLEPSTWSDSYKAEHPTYTKWPYNQKVAKIFVSLKSDRAGKELRPNEWRSYLASRLYVPGGDSFKLNLFPLASRKVTDASWEKTYREHPFLASKQHYVERCRQVRFPFFAAKRRQYHPRVVLGTGKGFTADFVSAFGFMDAPYRRCVLGEENGGRECVVYTQGDSHLVVSPFLGGPSGVNRNVHLSELGRLISSLLGPSKGDD